jgi:membrane associated rhomboid family serine protease
MQYSRPYLYAYALIGLHVGVYAATSEYAPYFVQRTVTQQTTLSLSNFQRRPQTLITHAFSHASPFHLLINSYMCYQFLPPLIYSLGASKFALLYTGSAAAGGALQLTYNSTAYKRREVRSVGASGALSGLLAYEAFLFPQSTILLFGVVPFQNSTFAGLFFLGNIYGLYADTKPGASSDGLAYASHIGGTLFGLAFAVARKRRILR